MGGEAIVGLQDPQTSPFATSLYDLSLDEIEERILNEIIDEINRDPDLIIKYHLSVRKRAQLYVQNIRGHFEMFRQVLNLDNFEQREAQLYYDKVVFEFFRDM